MSTQKKLSIYSLVLLTLIAALVIISYHFISRSYIEERARTSIIREIDRISGEGAKYLDDDFYDSELIASQDVVKIFVYQGDFQMQSDYLFDDIAGGLLKKLAENKAANSKTAQEISVHKIIESHGEYYAALLPAHLISGDSSSYDFFKTESERPDILLYVSTRSLSVYSDAIRNIFIIVLSVFGTAGVVFANRMGAKIDESRENMRRFFQNASHELKTPITSIQGYAEGMKHGVIKDKDKATDIILASSEGMAQLVDEVLYISKQDSATYKPKIGAVDLKELCYSVLYRFESEFETKNIKAVPKLGDGEKLVSAVDDDLEKAISNIVSNALRYAKSFVEISIVSQKNNWLVKVVDDGAGISPNDLPHIFDRFYTGTGGKTGIGLSLALEIIKRAGGSLQAKNTPAGGAEFEISLPKRK